MESRPALILKLLTQDYIETAVPVASQVLVDRYGLDFSPATVRNDLAELEMAGYIIQPHTSAGRIPTELAYRQLIADLQPAIPATSAKKLLDPIIVNLADNWKEVAKVLAQLTSNGVFWSFHRYNSYYTGLSGLFSQPEFRQISMVYDISQVIDRLEETIDELFEDLDYQPIIQLGSDSPFGNFSSTILTKYRFGQHIGLFGLLAPLRTDYLTNFNLINYVYRTIQETNHQ